MTARSNTAGNSATGKPFTKGDPRINKKGRPKSFDAARELGQQIANEVVTDAAGNPALLNGKKITRIELILRTWAQSKDPRLQQAFVELAYGKTPVVNQVTGDGGGPLEVLIKYADPDGHAT